MHRKERIVLTFSLAVLLAFGLIAAVSAGGASSYPGSECRHNGMYCPTRTATNTPTDTPTFIPTNTPTDTPTPSPTVTPTNTPTPFPTRCPGGSNTHTSCQGG